MSNRPQQASVNSAQGWCKVSALDFLRISGADAKPFLQGQLTCDVDLLSRETPLPCAWCSPAGRVRYSGWLVRHRAAYLLLLAADRARECAAALAPYVMRARVVLEAGEDTGFALSWRPAPEAVADPASQAGEPDASQWMLPGSPARCLRFSDSADASADSRARFLLAGVRAGVCELPAALENRYLPQMLNLDLTGGISFTKGCFPGQEVIARMHHLGRVKRRLMRFRTERGDCPPGTDILAGQDAVGKVAVSTGDAGAGELLAVVNLSQAGASLALDLPGQPALFLKRLPYALPGLPDG